MVAKNLGRSRKKEQNEKLKTGKEARPTEEEAVNRPLPFAVVVDAADHLSEEEQQELVAIVRRRLAESARKRLVADAEEARQEFAAGRCKPATPDELMREIRR